MDAFPDRLHAVACAEGAPRLQAPAGILGLANVATISWLPAAGPSRPVLRVDELARELLLKTLSMFTFGKSRRR